MVWIVLTVLSFILSFILLGIDWSDSSDFPWKIRIRHILSLISLVFLLIGSIKTVPTGSTGIVTTFGKVESVTLDAGIHFMAPWKKVIKMDNRTQKAQIELSCFSSDIQEVSVVYTINYQLNKQNAQDLYRTVGVKYYETVIVPRVQECVKAQFAKYTAEALIADRNIVASSIEEDLSINLAKYNIDLGDTAIEDIDFSDEFTNAAEAKVTAQQKKLTAKTEQETANIQAQAEAERQLIKAKADADAALLAAKNDAEVAKVAADSAEYQGQKDAAIMSNLGKMLQTYPELIKYYYVTGWDGNMPETILGNDSNVMMNLK